MTKNVLIVDDDSGFVTRILNSASCKNFCFSIAGSLNQALFIIENNQFDLVIANFKIPGGNSLVLRSELKKLSPETSLLFMSSFDSDYNYVKSNGEECYYKFDLKNSIGRVLESV